MDSQYNYSDEEKEEISIEENIYEFYQMKMKWAIKTTKKIQDYILSKVN